MYMQNVATKERWFWTITRAAIALGVVAYTIFVVVTVITLFTNDTIRVALQDGSTQACFVQPE